MPSHIAHALFTEEVILRSLPEDAGEIFDRQRSSILLGAQGPDIFYHNRRTKPSGLLFGRLLHTRGYGTFCGHLARFAREEHGDRRAMLHAFLLGFATHAILDRTTHPFITWFAGWRQRGREETRKYALTHAFLERILDVELLRLRSGIGVEEYAFAPHLEALGGRMPAVIRDALAYALARTYPRVDETRDPAAVIRRLENAWSDTLSFYGATDPPQLAARLRAHRQEMSGEDALRRLAIFHPLPLPDGRRFADLVPGLDPMNLRRKTWTDPCDPGPMTDAAFPELYETALDSAVSVLREVSRVLRGDAPPEAVEAAAGNTNLADGKTEQPCRPSASDPMPLPELLQELFRLYREGQYP